MSAGKHIAMAAIMAIAYLVGLPLLIVGFLATPDKNILFIVIGLLLCGLPFAVFFFVIGGAFVLGKSKWERFCKKLLIALVGLVLGVVATPIMICVHIGKAVKIKKQAQEADKNWMPPVETQDVPSQPVQSEPAEQ